MTGSPATAGEDVGYWAEPGELTDVSRHREWIATLPDDPVALRHIVSRLLLHPHWAEAYDVKVDGRGWAENIIRPAAGILDAVMDRSGGSIDPFPADGDRVIGTCRHFAVVLTALLRAKGIPARSRAGHSSVFEDGKWVDHWITEWWDRDDERWVRVDAQIDDLQRDLVPEPVDPDDLTAGGCRSDPPFLAGGECWQAIARDEVDPEVCGIDTEWGAWFVRFNVVKDLAALNKVEMLPWDDWGLTLELQDRDTPEAGPAMNAIAEVTVPAVDLAALRRTYDDDRFRVPAVISTFGPEGRVELDWRSV